MLIFKVGRELLFGVSIFTSPFAVLTFNSSPSQRASFDMHATLVVEPRTAPPTDPLSAASQARF